MEQKDADLLIARQRLDRHFDGDVVAVMIDQAGDLSHHLIRERADLFVAHLSVIVVLECDRLAETGRYANGLREPEEFEPGVDLGREGSARAAQSHGQDRDLGRKGEADHAGPAPEQACVGLHGGAADLLFARYGRLREYADRLALPEEGDCVGHSFRVARAVDEGGLGDLDEMPQDRPGPELGLGQEVQAAGARGAEHLDIGPALVVGGQHKAPHRGNILEPLDLEVVLLFEVAPENAAEPPVGTVLDLLVVRKAFEGVDEQADLHVERLEEGECDLLSVHCHSSMILIGKWS